MNPCLLGLVHVTCVVNAVTLDICRTLAPHGGRILHIYIVSTFLNEQLNCPELAIAILPHQPGVQLAFTGPNCHGSMAPERSLPYVVKYTSYCLHTNLIVIDTTTWKN